MAYKQNPGRGPMMKTGAGVPSALLQKTTDPKEGEKKSFPGQTFKSGKPTQEKGSYSRYQEDAALADADKLAARYERDAINSGRLPSKAKPYQPYGSYSGDMGKSFRTRIDEKSGAVTFDAGRSDQQLTIPRDQLMKLAARKELKGHVSNSFTTNNYLKNRKK